MAIIPNPVQRENSIEETLGDRRTDHGSGKETAQQQSWRNPSLSVSRFTERLIVSGTVGGRRGIWIQFVQPVNKWFGGRTAGTCGVTGRMIPCQRYNSRFRKELANRRHQGIKRQLRTKPKVQHSLRLSDGGRIGVDQGPAGIKDSPAEIFRHVQRLQPGCAQSGHDEHKLEIRHPGMLDIQGLHSGNIRRSCQSESILQNSTDCSPTHCVIYRRRRIHNA